MWSILTPRPDPAYKSCSRRKFEVLNPQQLRQQPLGPTAARWTPRQCPRVSERRTALGWSCTFEICDEARALEVSGARFDSKHRHVSDSEHRHVLGVWGLHMYIYIYIYTYIHTYVSAPETAAPRTHGCVMDASSMPAGFRKTRRIGLWLHLRSIRSSISAWRFGCREYRHAFDSEYSNLFDSKYSVWILGVTVHLRQKPPGPTAA